MRVAVNYFGSSEPRTERDIRSLAGKADQARDRAVSIRDRVRTLSDILCGPQPVSAAGKISEVPTDGALGQMERDFDEIQGALFEIEGIVDLIGTKLIGERPPNS